MGGSSVSLLSLYFFPPLQKRLGLMAYFGGTKPRFAVLGLYFFFLVHSRVAKPVNLTTLLFCWSDRPPASVLRLSKTALADSPKTIRAGLLTFNLQGGKYLFTLTKNHFEKLKKRIHGLDRSVGSPAWREI